MSRAVLLGSLLSVAAAQVQETVGCFLYPVRSEDRAFTFERKNDSASFLDINRILDCQGLCQVRPWCSWFTYYPEGRRCQLANENAPLTPTPLAEISIVGPRVCPDRPASCSVATFQGELPATKLLASQGPEQPRKGACWPRTFNDETRANIRQWYVADNCPGTPRVLENITNCTTREAAVDLSERDCQQRCYDNVHCASWWMAGGKCYNGMGMNCKPGVSGSQGQRVERGEVVVLRTLPAQKRYNPPMVQTNPAPPATTSLFEKIFDNATYPDEASAVKACENACRSYVGCAIWQYIKFDGCYMDVATYLQEDLTYPVTLENFKEDANVVAGQLLQHRCPSAPPRTLPTTTTTPTRNITNATAVLVPLVATAPAAGGLPWWGWALIAVGAALLLGLLFALLSGSCGDKTKKRSKKNKVQEREALLTPSPAPQPTQAVPTTSQALPIYTSVIQAPPVYMVAEPTPIYTTAPSVQLAPIQLAQPVQVAQPVQTVQVAQPVQMIQTVQPMQVAQPVTYTTIEAPRSPVYATAAPSSAVYTVAEPAAYSVNYGQPQYVLQAPQ